MEYASAAKGNAALTTGIIGTAGVGLGLLGNLLGLNGVNAANVNGCGCGCASVASACGCSEDHFVNRYEAGQDARIAELETEIKLRDANIYTMGEMNKLRNYVDDRFNGINAQLSSQAVINAQTAANLSCMQGQIATFANLTKTVIPIDSICPEPMQRYNSWTAPTAPAATT